MKLCTLCIKSELLGNRQTCNRAENNGQQIARHDDRPNIF